MSSAFQGALVAPVALWLSRRAAASGGGHAHIASRRARQFCIRLALLGALSAVAYGQAKSAFDPARDLPGFETARSSEYKDLFPLDKYSDLLGDEMDAATLDKTRAAWTADSGAVQKHLDEIRANPREGMRWLLTERMSKHKFFSRVGFTVDDSAPPFLIFVQKPSRDDPEYAPAIVKMFLPFLTKIDAQMEARIGTPAGAPRRADRPWTPIAILASTGDLQNYDKRGHSRDSFTVGARYDKDLDLVVGFVNSFDEPKASIDVVYPILRESCAAILRTHLAAGAKESISLWLQEGIASAFAYPRAAKPESLEKLEVRANNLKLLVDTCHDANSRNILLLPVAKLVTIHTWDDLVRAAFGTNPQPARYAALSPAFLAESTVWMHFLLGREDGKYRASFEHFLGLALKGMSESDAFTQSFPEIKPADLDREFWAWVYDEYVRAFPSGHVDRDVLTGLFAAPVKGVDEIAAKALASLGTVPAPPPEPPFDPALLVVTDKEVEAQHGLALVAARSGDFEAARKSLTSLAPIAAVPDSGRIARDLERLTAAIRLRENILSAMAQKQLRLNVERDGKKLSLAVAKVENGAVVFAENKQGVPSMPLAAVDPAELVRMAERKEMPGDAPQWARAWLMLLAGDARWDKSFKVDSDQARDLREDGKVWFADRLRAGEAALILCDLAKKTTPKTRAEAEPIVASIEMLMSKYATSTCVLFKKSGLSRFARDAVGVLSADVDPAEAVHGKVTTDAEGRITLSYTFDDAAEGDDFVKQPGYLGQWRKAWKPIAITEDQSTSSVSKGGLHLRGDALWRLPIGFSVPLTIKVEHHLLEDKGNIHPAPIIAFLACDDGQEDYSWCGSLGGLSVYERQGETGSSESKTHAFFFNQNYHLEFSIDSKHLTSTLDKERMSEMQAGPRKGGGVLVLVHSELEFVIDSLEITGAPDPASLAVMRSEWAKRKLAKMGF